MYVLVNLASLKIDYRYNIEYPPEINTKTHVGIEIPADVDVDCTMALKNADGAIIIKQDPDMYRLKIASLKSAMRTQRDQLLTASDWTQFRDSPLTTEQQDAWALYRKALRDLPTNTADPTQAVWPTPPS